MKRSDRIPSLHGYSLLELSLVLTILAIVVAGGITLTTTKVSQERASVSHDELADIDDALGEFVIRQDRLPCPARLDVPRGDAEFGREATDCADDSPPSGTIRVEYPAASGNFVRIGGVPFYALRLPDEYFADAWGNRYLYAVSEGFIADSTLESEGTITVQDDGGNSISDEIVWVLVSHGESGKGGFDAKTAQLSAPCDAADRDGENCDGDGIFLDVLFNDGDTPANFFDDQVRWETRMRLYAMQAGDFTADSEEDAPECAADGADKFDSYGSSCYAIFTDLVNHTTASTTCQAWGGELVSIETSDEDDWLETFVLDPSLSNANNHLWISLNDEASEGSYVWGTGEAAVYFNWRPGQPDGPGTNNAFMRYDAGGWDDEAATATHLRTLCERAAPDCTGGDANGTYAGSCYAHFAATDDWAGQEAVCVAWGGHLASVTSAAESTYITGTLLNGTYNHSWIGLNDIDAEGSYEWVADGSALGGWNNWMSTAPSGGGDCGMMAASTDPEPGEWTDQDCTLTTYEAICEKPL